MNTRALFRTACSMSLALAALASPVRAGAPLLFSHHGRLLDAADAPLNATVKITVRVYYRDTDPTGSGSSLVWEEDYENVKVSNGAYSVLIGDPDKGKNHTTLDALDWDGDEQRWFTVAINDDPEMTPRLRIGSVPFAIRALDADTVGGKPETTFARAAHTHDFADIDDLTSSTPWPGTVPWSRVTAKDSTYPPAAHSHPTSDVNNFTAAVAAALGDATVPAGLGVQGKLNVQKALGGNDVSALQHDLQFQIGSGLGTSQSRSVGIGVLDNGKAAIQVKEANVGYNDLLLQTVAGNVGIGLGAQTPTEKLQVDGNIKIGYGGQLLGGLSTEFLKFGNASSQSATVGAGGVVAIQVDSNNNETGAFFSVRTNGVTESDGTELMRVQDNGNVGIGTTAPAKRLEVSGTGTQEIQITKTDATVGNMRMRVYGASGDILIGGTTVIDMINGTTLSLLEAGGNVGIGTTTPQAKLDVNGAVAVGGNKVILWQEFATPLIKEFSFTGSQTFNVTVTSMPAGARYILAEVFVTAGLAGTAVDHQNIVLGRGVTALTNYNSRGVQPSTVFSAASSMARHAVTLTHPGETDGFGEYYGTWYGSQVIPLNANSSFDFNNNGNSGSNGWIYMVIRAYSL
jgi:hypothetical protein